MLNITCFARVCCRCLRALLSSIRISLEGMWFKCDICMDWDDSKESFRVDRISESFGLMCAATYDDSLVYDVLFYLIFVRGWCDVCTFSHCLLKSSVDTRASSFIKNAIQLVITSIICFYFPNIIADSDPHWNQVRGNSGPRAIIGRTRIIRHYCDWMSSSSFHAKSVLHSIASAATSASVSRYSAEKQAERNVLTP